MKKRCLFFSAVLLLSCILAISGCNEIVDESSVKDSKGFGSTIGESTTQEETASIESEPQPRAVTFTTEDDLVIHGTLFGKGEKGVILAHMYPSDRTGWYKTAELLASEGYFALAFDFRGYNDSQGEKDVSKIYIDLDAACDFLEKNGAERIVLVGASMGGTASLKIAGTRTVAGVVALSAPVEFRGLSTMEELPAIDSPKLFMAAEGETWAVDCVNEFYDLTVGEKEKIIFKGSEHGTDMLNDIEGEKVMETILGFIRQVFDE